MVHCMDLYAGIGLGDQSYDQLKQLWELKEQADKEPSLQRFSTRLS